MSSLTKLEEAYLKKILMMNDGYVLNYSDNDFEEFFLKFDIAIHDSRYQKFGTSKAKKLRAFWELESDKIVAQSLSDLLDRYEELYKFQPDVFDKDLLKKCRTIVDRLRENAPKSENRESENISYNLEHNTSSYVDFHDYNSHDFVKDEAKIRIFISYSWDSDEYREKVRELHDKLEAENEEMDVILDYYDLLGGVEQSKFMEVEPRKADKVLMLCSKRYVQKVKDGVGGAAREESIISSEMAVNIGKNKIIPVMINISPEDLPLSVKGTHAIDFNRGWNEEYNKLVASLKGKPLAPQSRSNLVAEENPIPDYDISVFTESEIEILIEMINSEDKKIHIIICIGPDSEEGKRRIARNLEDAGLLRCINDKETAFELTGEGEKVANKLQNGKYEKLQETIEIEEKLLLEISKRPEKAIFISPSLGTAGQYERKVLRIAKNLEYEGLLRCSDSEERFELTRTGEFKANELNAIKNS